SSGRTGGPPATPRWRRRSTTSASTTGRGRSPLDPTIDLEDLGFDRGAHLLVDRALSHLAPGDRLGVRGRDPHLKVHLPAWARKQGHGVTAAASNGGGAGD